MPIYTIEYLDGYYWLMANGIPCKRYNSLAEAKQDNPGVEVAE